jgi:hypothetical protein
MQTEYPQINLDKIAVNFREIIVYLDSLNQNAKSVEKVFFVLN